MKLKNKIIILVSVIVLLIAAVIVLTVVSSKYRKNEEYNKVNPVQITSVSSAVKNFCVTTEEEKYTVTCVENVWFSPENANAFLNQEYVENAFATACSLMAIPVEMNVVSLEKYGLDAPKVSFDFADEAGNKYVLKFGNKVPTGVGYYISVNDEKNVYIVLNEQYDILCGGLDSLRNKQLINISSEDFYSITIKNANSAVTVGPKTTNDPNAHSSTIWEMTYPYQKDVDKYAFETKVVNALDFTIYGFVDDNPSDYGKYGLDNPKYTIVLEMYKGSFTILLGNTFFSEDGSDTKLIYMQVEGLPNVFSIKEEQVSYKDLKPVDLLESLVFSRIISCVDTINYKNAGVSHVLKVDEPKFYFDDVEVEEGIFRDVYNKIILPVILGEVTGEVGSEICSFTFNYNTDTPSETLTFYEYGDLYAAAEVNGNTHFYVKKSNVEDMVNAINNLAE